MSVTEPLPPFSADSAAGAEKRAPILLDGMEVLFDRAVGLYPVQARLAAENGDPGESGHRETQTAGQTR